MSQVEKSAVPTASAWANARVKMHTTLNLVHRYVGLAIALFLVSAGITGSLLTWNTQLERVFAPSLFVVPPHSAGSRTLDPFTLRNIALERFPGAQITAVPLDIHSDEAVGFSLEYPASDGSAAQNAAQAVADDQVFLDAVTGQILGSRRSGDIRQGLKNIMPFVYSIHESLALDAAGNWVLGVAALLWVVICLTGGYLTFPAYRIRAAATQKSWMSRWWPSWKIRSYGDFKKINFDFHRAGSLWLWVILLVFALSAVSFNLRSVYLPAIKATLGYSSTFDSIPRANDSKTPPALGVQEAYRIAKPSMATAATAHNFRVLKESLFMYYPVQRIYDYRVSSTKDVGPRNSNTRLFIQADTGRVVGLDLPTGVSGNTFTSWIEALHEAQVLGMPYRVFETALGVILALLSVSGVIVWLKKKRPGELRRMFRVFARDVGLS